MADKKALTFFYENETQFGGGDKYYNFIEVLLHFATIDENTFFDVTKKRKDMHLQFSTNSEDIEFKKLVWSGILTAL